MKRAEATIRPAAGTRPPSSDPVARVTADYQALSPAERRVADTVLADIAFAVEASNAALARRAGVSEPTVTRFCRSVGCSGVRDFKIKLAQRLAAGPLTEGGAEAGTARPAFWNAVFGEAYRAVRNAERQIDPACLQTAAELVAGARQVAVFGLGGSSAALAQETQYRLFRYGVSVTAHRDAYLMRMRAATLGAGDVAVALSATGRTAEMIEAVQLAQRYRARAICVTAPQSALARAGDVALTVAIAEYPDTLKPTASRYAFLAAVDLLATATGYCLGGSALESLRRIRETVQSHRNGQEPDPLGD